MNQNLLDMAATHGIWAALAVGLIFYILKAQEKRDFRQEEREHNFQKIITDLTNHLDTLDELREDVNSIKEKLIQH